MPVETSDLPAQHRALVITSRDKPLTVEDLPTPQPGPGSLIVKVLASTVLAYAGDVYSGKRPYPFPTPMVPGSNAIARVAAIGPDTTAFQVGDLVMVDEFIRARDDSLARFLPGLHDGTSAGGKKLMEGEFRDWTYAEYAKVPLETVTQLESVKQNSIERLAYMSTLLIPFGGILALDIQMGETVIVAPATGKFGGAAVELALAMGAKVIAAGRNSEALKEMSSRLNNHRLTTVALTGDVSKDTETLGPADAYIDISPPAASKSPHIKACIMALKVYGKMVLWGGIAEDVPLPYQVIMRRCLQLRGQWMYGRDTPGRIVKMVEAGFLSLDHIRHVGSFGLEKWKEAFDAAEENSGWAAQVLICP